jgi:hypothetical protein
MRAILSAFALGIACALIIAPAMLVTRLSDGQLDTIVQGVLGICGGFLLLVVGVGAVALWSWRDERRRNRPITAQWEKAEVVYRPAHEPPAVQPQPQYSMGRTDYDLMPVDGDTRYRFRGK